MSNPTSAFGWQMPTSSDLVTDLPADFEVFGQAVDTSLADLKGGTTGQVLSKASNTDMDFTWVAQDDSNAIQNAIVDAKGDLIAATAADTPARLAVGTNGQVLTADSTASTGLAWTSISAGSMTTLASGSLSGSSVSLTSISQSYKSLRLVLRGCSISGNDQMTLQINTRNSGYSFSTIDSLNGLQSTASSGASIYKLTTANQMGSAVDQSFVIDFPDYANTNSFTIFEHVGVYTQSPANTMQSCSGSGANSQAAAINSIQIKADYGGAFTWDAGTYILYGVN